MLWAPAATPAGNASCGNTTRVYAGVISRCNPLLVNGTWAHANVSSCSWDSVSLRVWPASDGTCSASPGQPLTVPAGCSLAAAFGLGPAGSTVSVQCLGLSPSPSATRSPSSTPSPTSTVNATVALYAGANCTAQSLVSTAAIGQCSPLLVGGSLVYTRLVGCSLSTLWLLRWSPGSTSCSGSALPGTLGLPLGCVDASSNSLGPPGWTASIACGNATSNSSSSATPSPTLSPTSAANAAATVTLYAGANCTAPWNVSTTAISQCTPLGINGVLVLTRVLSCSSTNLWLQTWPSNASSCSGDAVPGVLVLPLGCTNASSFGLGPPGWTAGIACGGGNGNATSNSSSATPSRSPWPGNATSTPTATATATSSATGSATPSPPSGLSLTGSIAFFADGDVTCDGKPVSLAPVGPVCSPVVVGRAVVYYRLVACGKGKGVMTMYRDGECGGQGKNVSFDKGCTPTVTTSYTFKCGNGTVGVAAGSDTSDERGAAQRLPLAGGGGGATPLTRGAAAADGGPAAPTRSSPWLAAASALAAVVAACLAAVAARRRLAAASQPARGADAAVALLSRAPLAA